MGGVFCGFVIEGRGHRGPLALNTPGCGKIFRPPGKKSFSALRE
jgi:hypothetical protein